MSGEPRTPAAAFQASRAEQLKKIDALDRHERQVLKENQRLELRQVMFRVER